MNKPEKDSLTCEQAMSMIEKIRDENRTLRAKLFYVTQMAEELNSQVIYLTRKLKAYDRMENVERVKKI